MTNLVTASSRVPLVVVFSWVVQTGWGCGKLAETWQARDEVLTLRPVRSEEPTHCAGASTDSRRRFHQASTAPGERTVEHHVNLARAREDYSGARRVGMDETSAGKGQDYISVFADLDAGRVLFATEGRDASTVERFAADLVAHGGDPHKVTTTSSDMSAAAEPSYRSPRPARSADIGTRQPRRRRKRS